MDKNMNLVSMLSVNTRLVMVEKFLAYYRDLGVDNFVFGLHSLESDFEKMTLFLEKYGCRVGETLTGPMDFHQQQPKIENIMRKRFFKDEEWCIIADNDEYIEITSDHLKELDKGVDYDYIKGLVIDRFSADGKLLEVEQSTDLFKQFPLRGHIDMKYAGHYTPKVPLLKTKVEVGTGHHRAKGYFKPYGKTINVHHFKWTSAFLATIHRHYNDGYDRQIKQLLELCDGDTMNMEKIRPFLIT